ncbi:uncharacterized protein KLLA0_F24596g [Kluyveromyces lactis]|uniref:KLLA0F24596p n=1 Tax=Kluyveromyces lactis (strain ATCC 8585 / CBS 2359 / DSM 70799 / NBRC 1267 / NRRL Y-1140 / WM37) TaxID=284590 RepID=Q6CIR4_KLULA|nr:uncharacterized protein KLLA0_F24596g [Kluyveromyces lactis]CAG98883.1 KLLA0F24596p [Kluyveromyces lactis]|eukprot:XP_456175.1 uncharacterized protein KLLA0_F24596g [Kluyveromyces lactis]
MADKVSFTKRKLIKYSSMICGSLEECGELDLTDGDLEDILVPQSRDNCAAENWNGANNYTHSISPADYIIERKLLSPNMTGWQWQANKQKMLESEILKLIEQEKPEDHLKRFTRSTKKKDSQQDEPVSPISISGSEQFDIKHHFLNTPPETERSLTLVLSEMIVSKEYV